MMNTDDAQCIDVFTTYVLIEFLYDIVSDKLY